MDIEEDVVHHAIHVSAKHNQAMNPLIANKGSFKPFSGSIHERGSSSDLPTVRITNEFLKVAKLCKTEIPLSSKAANHSAWSKHTEEGERMSKFPTNSSLTTDRLTKSRGSFKKGSAQSYEASKKEYKQEECIAEILGQDSYKDDYKWLLESRQSDIAKTYKQFVANLCKTESLNYAKDEKRFKAKRTLCLGLQDILMSVSTFPEPLAIQVPIYLDCETLLGELYIQLRPYLFEFLQDISGKYEVILYSSLNATHLKAIMASIPELEKYFAFTFGADFCVFGNLSYGVKFLDFLLKNRALEDILLVDKTLKSLPRFPYNFMPALMYDKDKAEDKQLIKLSIAIDYIMSKKTVQEGIHGCL